MKFDHNNKTIELTAEAFLTFYMLWEDRLNHSLNPPIPESTLQEKAATAELKKLKLITTFTDEHTSARHADFKAAGDTLGELLDTGAIPAPKKPAVRKAKASKAKLVDKELEEFTAKATGKKPAAPAKKTAKPGKKATPAKKTAKKTTAPAAAKPAPAPAPKPKAHEVLTVQPVDRLNDRWAAVRETVALVKADDWDTDEDYTPTVDMLAKKYSHLIKKGWQDKKKQAYMEGIVNFAIASCRKG